MKKMNSIILVLCLITISYSLQINPSMIRLYRNVRTSLPTNANEKYFFTVIDNYFSYTTIYLCLQDDNFRLNLVSVKYCYTNDDPSYFISEAVKKCSFKPLSCDTMRSPSSSIYYYYSFTHYTNKSYIIVHYDWSLPSGNLYATSDYKDLSIEEKKDDSILVIVLIIVIIIIILIILAFIIFLLCCCCRSCVCYRKSQYINNPMPLIQNTNYMLARPVNYPLSQPEDNYQEHSGDNYQEHYEDNYRKHSEDNYRQHSEDNYEDYPDAPALQTTTQGNEEH